MNQASVQVGNNMLELNLVTWYTERELFYCPIHFTKVGTELTDESLAWVYENLHGRFHVNRIRGGINEHKQIYFEDPQEAIFFELVWS